VNFNYNYTGSNTHGHQDIRHQRCNNHHTSFHDREAAKDSDAEKGMARKSWMKFHHVTDYYFSNKRLLGSQYHHRHIINKVRNYKTKLFISF